MAKTWGKSPPPDIELVNYRQELLVLIEQMFSDIHLELSRVAPKTEEHNETIKSIGKGIRALDALREKISND